MTNTDAKIQEILDAFKPYDRVYKRRAVNEAVKLKEEISPHLMAVLEDTLTNPDKYIAGDYMTHIYAFVLLGYFKETRGHKLIVDLFSLPESRIVPLFDDLITEDLPIMLFRTCDGLVAEIKRLILNQEAYDFCRGAALDALTYAVVEGILPREEALAFLETLFTGEEADEDSEFWTFVAEAICDLYPEELMPVIERAFREDRIDRMFTGPEVFAETLKQSKAHTLEALRKKLHRRSPDNIHKYMSWWAIFELEDVPLPSPSSSETVLTETFPEFVENETKNGE